MATDTNLNQLVINKLTRAQYQEAKEAGSIVETEIYMITDDNSVAPHTHTPDEVGALSPSDVVDNVTSDSATQPLSAKQGKYLNDRISAITGNMEDLGGGDMMKANYDVDGDGIVDNAAQLEGHGASYFATASDLEQRVPKCVTVTTANTDLNEYITEGWYSFSDPFTPVNIPIGVNGWLQVVRRMSVDDARIVVKQFWYRLGNNSNDHESYMRTYDNDDGWTDWKKFMTDKDVVPVSQGGTGATTAVGALDNLGAPNLNNITDNEHSIASGDDLNNYTTAGTYRCASSEIAASLTNAPSYTSAGFRLIVSSISSTTGCVQIAIYNSKLVHIFIRVQFNDGTWGVWKHNMTNILTSEEYGDFLPDAGTTGRIFYKKAGA